MADEVLRNQLSLLSSSKAPTELKAPFDLKEFMVPKIIECSLPGGLFFYKSVLPDQFAISTGDTARALTTRCVDPENVTVVKVSFYLFSKLVAIYNLVVFISSMRLELSSKSFILEWIQ